MLQAALDVGAHLISANFKNNNSINAELEVDNRFQRYAYLRELTNPLALSTLGSSFPS